MAQVTIDGVAYDNDALSDVAKQQLLNLQATDAEIRHLQIQLAIANTARGTYAAALREELPKITD